MNKTFLMWVKIVGIANLVTGFGLFTWLFVLAYFNKGFKTCIDINAYGEAHIEAILLILFYMPTLYIIYSMIKREARG